MFLCATSITCVVSLKMIYQLSLCLVTHLLNGSSILPPLIMNKEIDLV